MRPSSLGAIIALSSSTVNATSKSGMTTMHDVPSPICMKFPEPFVQMGMASHRAFDQIARDAKTANGSGPILQLLAEASQNHVACHATYRFAPPR